MNLDSIAAALTIATLLSGAFSYIVIRPLQKAIDINSNVLTGLRKELERSAADRRSLDVRVSKLEEAHRINKGQINHILDRLDHT
nr:MAG TPA: hypothetical protein [Caudoviricetes sp.]